MNTMNELRYGNLNKELQAKLSEENIFTQYMGEFAFIDFPNYAESSEEIIEIIETQKKSESSDKWQAIKDFCDLWDEDIMQALETTLTRLNIPFDEEYLEYLNKVSDDLGALIVQLKNHYQRPRPYQLAFYTEQDLHPYYSFSAVSPSYPSGHACQALFLCHLIGFHYEDKKEELLKLAKQVADSRIILGVHYKSDNLFGFEIVRQLLLKNDIKEKYFPNV
jgi:hypothetical protein